MPKGSQFCFRIGKHGSRRTSSPNLLWDPFVFTENEQIPTVVGTDANAHHTIWGSSNINPRGEDLLAYCGSAELDFCNVGIPSKHARSGQCWPSVGRVGKTSANFPTLCQCCQCFANIFANAVIILEVSFLEFFHDCVMILGHFLLLIAFQFAKNTFFLLRFSQRW